LILQLSCNCARDFFLAPGAGCQHVHEVVLRGS